MSDNLSATQSTLLLPSDPMLDGGDSGMLSQPPQYQQRASFNNNIRDPLRQRIQQGRNYLQRQGSQLLQSSGTLQQLKAPGFFLKYRQLMVITVLGIIFYVLCVVRVKTKPQIPIVVGLATTAMMIYFMKRYADQVSTAKVATAGWVFVAGLVAAIVAMSVWFEETK